MPIGRKITAKRGVRKQISARTRFEIFKRDQFTCQYCGATPPGALLHVDHIHPVADGGTNDEDNLVTSCDRCNLGKAAVPLSVVPKSIEEQAAEIAEREAQIAGYAEIARAARQRIEDDMWTVAEALHPGASNGYPRDRCASIKTFLKRLPIHEIEEAAWITRDFFGSTECRASFKYFCGICWNKIRAREHV